MPPIHTCICYRLHFSDNQAQSIMVAKFLTSLEKNLHTQTNSKQRPFLFAELFQRLDQSLLSELTHGVAKGSNAGQDKASCFFHIGEHFGEF